MNTKLQRLILPVLAVITGLGVILRGYPLAVSDGLTVDPDTQTRIAFLAGQLSRGTLADYEFLRNGAPGGMQMHWTLPFDLFCTALAAPMAALWGWEPALSAAALAAGPLSYICLCLSVLYLVKSAGTPRGGPWALTLLAFANPVTGYAAIGRLNHHVITVAVTTMALGAAIRLIRRPGAAAGAVAASWAVLSLWESMETLAAVAAAVGIVAAGAAYGAGRASGFRVYASLLPLLAAAALVCDPDPDGILSFATDRLSLFHLLSLLAAGGLVLAAPSVAGSGTFARRMCRLAAAAAVPAALLGTLAMRHFPDVLSDPQAVAYFWDNVQELRPAWSGWPYAVNALFPGVPAALVCLTSVRMRRPGPVRTALFCAAAVLTAETALAVMHARLDLYPAVTGSAVLGCYLRGAVARFLKQPDGRIGDAALTAVAGTACAVALAVGAGAVAGGSPPLMSGCALGAAVSSRIEEALPGGAIVAADVFVGPELLARTGLRIVAGPYHRGVSGLHDLALVFNGTDMQAAAGILKRRGVAAVEFCDGVPGHRRPQKERTLGALLASGDTPAWLTEKAVDPTGRIRLYLLELKNPEP